MLFYTGHPLLDVGIATVTEYAQKRHPEDVTESDLAAIADYMTRNYVVNPLKSFLNVAFLNSGYTQVAFEKTPEKRLEYANDILRAYQDPPLATGERCVFTGEAAQRLTYRNHIPLLTGEGFFNFVANGRAGVPISGKALLCLQALPLGCAKCGGQLLTVHSDNAALMQLFAGQFLQSNLKSISLAQASNSSKLEGAKRQAKTLLLENLTVALRKQENAIEDGMTCSVTAYLWSNSGQDPSLSIFHLPNNIIQFLVRMERQYSLAWQQLVARAWELAPLKKGMSEADFVPRRNWLYEDLLGLAQSDGHRTRAFLRAYFLRYPLRTAKSGFGNPQVQYSLRNEFDLVSWQLTAEFLERILGMDKNRIQHIRQLASALATYVAQENDRKFFSQLYTAKKYPFLRQKLIKANLDWAKRGNAPFLDFERFIGVFEDGEDLARVDWELCRDLLLIGMVDDLHRSGWFGKNLSVFDEIDSANTPES